MTRLLSSLLGTAALALPLLAGEAMAQTSITEDQTETLRTSTTGDLTISPDATVTPATGQGVVVDSSNDVQIDGAISIEDRDDATGVEIETGNAGDVTLSGAISVTEDFTPDDTDDDPFPDGRFAQGSGRTGILISGASTFTGNVTSEAGSQITVEGNDSFGVRLADTATLAGTLDLASRIAVTGDRSVAVAVEGDVDGDVAVGGTLSTTGEDARSVVIAGDVSGGFETTATIANTGYRFPTRQASLVRELFTEEDSFQAGSAVQISGNIAGGIFFREEVQTVTDNDGNETSTILRASLNQAGGAPAILVDGAGTPIAIGVVAEITDVADPNFDSDLQYAFINQGDLAANGVLDDINATLFEAHDVTLTGGLSNSGLLSATTFRSGDDGTADAASSTGLARVIVFGDNVIADRIDNSGIILAQVSETADTVFADRDNILGARFVRAVAIDIGAMSELAELNNAGSITALVTGRDGESIVVRDASGTLSTITNTGTIQALGVSSDPANVVDGDFNLVAFDLSANTIGVSLTQSQTDGGSSPLIAGNILLGSGDDSVTSTAGGIIGDIAFGDGTDSLTFADTQYVGAITDSDGTLALRVTGGTLGLSGSQPLRVADAQIDGSASLLPSIDGQAGTASTIISSGDLTVGENVTIRPVLESLVGGVGDPTRFALLQAANLDFAPDVATLGGGFSPFLYDTTYTLDPDTGTLFVDFRLRSTEELGLSELQGSAFDATFEALGANPELARAIINIDNGESFDAAYNQLLPEFAAAARQFVLANTDGAVGAVGSHLDAARRGQAQPGGFWLQEFFYYADRERAQLAEQYRGQGFGFTGGFDTALGPFHAVGINAGFASTEIEDTVGTDEPLDLLTFQLGAYAGFETGGLGIDAYAGYGFNEFDSNRRVLIGDFAADSAGEWSGQHYNASLRAGYDLPIGKRFWARPTVSLDYLSLTEDAYTEDGPLGVAFDIDERTVDTGAVTAMLNLGAEFSGRRTWVRPALRVGYRNEFVGDVITTGRFAGLQTPFSIEAAEFPDQALIVGLSILAGSDFSSFGFELDQDIRDGFYRTTGRVVVRVLF